MAVLNTLRRTVKLTAEAGRVEMLAGMRDCLRQFLLGRLRAAAELRQVRDYPAVSRLCRS